LSFRMRSHTGAFVRPLLLWRASHFVVLAIRHGAQQPLPPDMLDEEDELEDSP